MMAERSGVLPVDKPAGPTSHDMVAAARRALRTRRVGHTGTLDPFASGLLLLCIGPATRLAALLSGLDKTYLARMRLGAATDTEDATGVVLERNEGWREIGEGEVRRALAAQVGERLQQPPQYSAKKVAGVRAYRLARTGRTADLAPVPVRIDEIRLTSFDPPDVDFEITCGSGTYVRSVARDAGRALGVGAHLIRLRRTRIDRFRIEDAVPADRLDDAAAVDHAWIEPLDALARLPRFDLSDEEAAHIRHGGSVPAPAPTPDSSPVVLAAGGRLVAIGEVRAGRLQPRRVLA